MQTCIGACVCLYVCVLARRSYGTSVTCVTQIQKYSGYRCIAK